MGPIANSVAVQPRPRWLPLLVLASASLAAFALLRRPQPAPPRAVPRLAMHAPLAVDLDTLARAHRSWVAEHGPGCARTPAHFAGYILSWVPAELHDPWGRPLDYRCTRDALDGQPTIVVELRSAGPDGEAGTADDLTGRDVHHL
jgi:hypothetical protein